MLPTACFFGARCLSMLPAACFLGTRHLGFLPAHAFLLRPLLAFLVRWLRHPVYVDPQHVRGVPPELHPQHLAPEPPVYLRLYRQIPLRPQPPERSSRRGDSGSGGSA